MTDEQLVRPARIGVYGALAAAVDGGASVGLLRSWMALAVGSLGVAGLFAVLLAVSRIPGIQDVPLWPLDFFKKGLVIHVVFSFVVWFLAVFGALLEVATARLGDGRPRGDLLGWIAVVGVTVAFPLLFVPALGDRGEPTLNNYIPTIIDPLYYWGLVVLGGAIALQAWRVLLNADSLFWPGVASPLTAGAVAGAIAYMVALVCFRQAWHGLEGQAPSHAFNEDLFWGGGHVLQFVNTGMMLITWWILASLAWGENVVVTRFFAVALALLFVLVLPTPTYFLLEDDPRSAFTNLQYTETLPLVIGLVAVVLAGSMRRRSGSWRDPAFLSLVLSAVVFALGGVLGMFVDGTDTRTPGHYHGVIAGISTAFMGLFLVVFLPLQERAVRRGKAVLLQIWLFAVGQGVASLGLFLAGGHGTPRKAAGAAQGLDDGGIWAKVGMGLNGVGGLVAVVGGILFFVTVARALSKRRSTPGQSGEGK